MAHVEKPSLSVDIRVIDCGADLEQLKKLPDQCIDLVYIDPLSDSNGTFKEFWKELKEKVVFRDCPESTQAYMDFMRPRCVELARVLKPTGSFYYHCDWGAEHYIKVMLGDILGKNNFINEVLWKRQSDHKDAGPGFKRLGRAHGVLLLYAGDSKCYFEHLCRPGDWDSAEKLYINMEPETGRRYRHAELVAQRETASSNGKPQYEFLGVTRNWRYSEEDMQKLREEGRIDRSTLGTEPYFKQYLDEVAGFPVGSVWDDLKPLHVHGEERLGYPSKDPLQLLEKILEIALQVNDADFGEVGHSGTALVASLNSAQQWIGIGHFANVLPPQDRCQDKLAPVGDSAAVS